MPQVTLEDETIERLDALRIEDESYDELIVELINIYRKTRPSASGLDPEGEGRKLR